MGKNKTKNEQEEIDIKESAQDAIENDKSEDKDEEGKDPHPVGGCCGVCGG